MKLETDAKAFRRLDTIMGLVMTGFAIAAIWTADGLTERLLIAFTVTVASAWHTCGMVRAAYRDGQKVDYIDARYAVAGEERPDDDGKD